MELGDAEALESVRSKVLQEPSMNTHLPLLVPPQQTTQQRPFNNINLSSVLSGSSPDHGTGNLLSSHAEHMTG